MKVTIIGGGNIGTLMAAEYADKGHHVTLYTSKPERWSQKIKVYNAEEELLKTAVLHKITNNMEEALADAEYVWGVTPAHTFENMAEKMLPYVTSKHKIGIVPGTGGAEFAFYQFIQKGCTFIGFQRVHSVARLKEYGHSVYELGRKAELRIGVIPASMTQMICNEVAAVLEMPCVPLDNYLSVTLTPSNPILHTTRLYTMFKNYREGMKYPRNFLFYEEWDDASSQMLIDCDQELQTLCDTIPLDLTSVASLQDYYESHSVRAMTEKITSIKAFKGLTSPMKKAVDGDGWIPDWESRYFTADFPYGLKIIKDLAVLFHVATPHIDEVYNWYEQVAKQPHHKVFSLTITKEQLLRLYR
ncbi:NAD/NADP-dependent octopine/nopaline dehydrogenase family protein [Massilicoli timonensis]|uniref:NAD/NADP octopine/nopaline dehydrogenase family protein n=2 Tax=Massilicoli timonensis TaxID=2015901 RepID=A0ABT1SHK9_9FIRM|nr:NAD/NADP-dependent octopine/nopaline dehydrogenase family protein [Massilicoli timonensis]MCQ5120699.1 NAD/NADP octopine/nopaline dehydrogenase family protein [Massilicoli timonensis]